MYHERTYEEISRQTRRRVVIAIIALVLCVVVALAVQASVRISRAQAVASVQESVVTAAMQCAAVEGSYPSSLAHLEDHYGLVIDHDHYLVYYEWVGDNIPPTVTVTAL